MMRRTVLALALLVACRRASPPVPPPVATPIVVPTPTPVSSWPTTLATALRAADSGRFAEADRLLQQHAVANAGTAEGVESDFWRALLTADPSNTGPTMRERMALLDAFLASAQPSPRATEAHTVRRLLEALDSTAAVLTTVRANADARARTKDEEIRRLSDELDRTRAELERIRKRLNPRP